MHSFITAIKRSVSITKSHFPGDILGCAYTICSYGQISIPCTIPNELSCTPSRFIIVIIIFIIIIIIKYNEISQLKYPNWN